jgi:hypothetical protein
LHRTILLRMVIFAIGTKFTGPSLYIILQKTK